MTDHDPQHDESLDPIEPVPQDAPQQPEADPQPTPAASAALTAARVSGLGQAQAIAELCLLAGQPQRTAEFLSAGLSEAQVRRSLLDARAEQADITSRITADAGTSMRPEHSPVVAATKKLAHKE